MTKRTLSLLLAAIMLSLCMLSGCGGVEEKLPDPDLSLNDQPKNEITVTAAESSHKKYGEVELFVLDGLTTSSPDGGITAYFWQDAQRRIYYSVTAGKEEVIEPSLLGLTMINADLSAGIESITSYDRADVVKAEYETCLTVSQKDVSCLDYCMQREIHLKKGEAGMTILVRVYNDGFAYRYTDVTTGRKDKETVISEASQIVLPKDTVTFAGGYSATYEFDYIERKYSELVNHSGVFNTPVTACTGKHWLLFSESDVYANDISYVKSVLGTNSGSGALNWQFGFKRDPMNEVTDELASPGHIRITEVATVPNFETPWRAAIITEDLNGLINSELIDSLCPEADSKLFKNTDWIKPGKVSWSWWSGGDQHNYDVQVEHVDFSSEYGWEYCCLDAGWPSFEDRISELCDYAEDKDVGIILWVNYLELKTPEEIEKLFSKWAKWGVKGVKTDYFESDDIEVLESMRNVAEIAAKHKLMVYYHGCINPCGETRTYPNIMSSEAVLGEEFRKWSTSPSPKNCLMYPFTRNIVGSMDYTPACIAITKTGESAGFSLAKSVVYESALQHFASSAYAFPSFLGLPFISRIPTAWKETKVIDGYPGEHITIMRTDGSDYYIGSMTLEKRKVSVPLDFLGDGSYNAYIYSDDSEGVLTLEEKTVTSSDTLKLELSDVGGAAVLITKDKINTEVEESPTSDKEGYTYYECEDGKTSGEARIADSSMCSGGKKVGYIGNGGFNKLEITVKAEKAGSYEMLIYLCSGESRSMDVTVNGKKYELSNLSSPGFDIPAEKSLNIELEKGENTITFSSSAGYAPDLDRIAVADKAK